MSEEDVENLTEYKMKKVRNLKMFKGKTDEEIIEFYRNRAPQPEPGLRAVVIPAEAPPEITSDALYEKSFKSKLKALQSEYGIDMNNSNDAELLRSLVRLIIQQETVNTQITKLQREDEVDTRTLKNLGDYQRSLISSVTEIQDKLGIARKIRQDKEVDEVAVFILDLKKKAKEFFDRKTVQVRCENCSVELGRYWLNFSKNTRKVHMEIKCPKCETELIHSVVNN